MPTITEEKFELIKSDPPFIRIKPGDYRRTYSAENMEIGLASIEHTRDAQEDFLAADIERISEFKQLTQEQRELALRETFNEMQEKHGNCTDGSTAAFAAAWKTENTFHITVGNVGDSHILLVEIDKQNEVHEAKQLHKLHKPTDPEEEKNILATGGSVWSYRLNGILALSRALGDKDFENNGLLHIPDIYSYNIEVAEGHQIYLVAASDGIDNLLGDLTSKSVPEIGELIKTNKDKPFSEIAERIILKSVGRFVRDNVSVGVMQTGSLLICDGHGGKRVSQAVSQHFYPCLQMISQKLLHEKDYTEVLKLKHQKAKQALDVKISPDVARREKIAEEIKKKFNAFAEEVKASLRSTDDLQISVESREDCYPPTHNLIFASENLWYLLHKIESCAKKSKIFAYESESENERYVCGEVDTYSYLDDCLAELKKIIKNTFAPTLNITIQTSIYNPTSPTVFKAEAKTVEDPEVEEINVKSLNLQ